MNDAAPMDDITERAKRAVGEDRPDADWILRPEEHARNLLPEADALRRILVRQEQTKIMSEYRANDGGAQWAQRRFKRAARIALCAALAATAVGAVFLMLPTKEVPPFLRLSGTGVEYFLLLVAFLAERYNARRQPYKEWMTKRARAEFLRGKIFDDVMQADERVQPSELPLLPLKLEYFRRYQFEVQKRYYRGRCREHQRAARRIKVLQQASFILAGLAGGLALLDSLSLLDADGLRLASSWYRGFIQFLASVKIDGERGLIALGAFASAIYGFAAAISLVDFNERNATRYVNTLDNLGLLEAQQLDAARRDAATGKETEVRQFVDRAQAFISSEHQEWVRWGEWAPLPDVRAVYIVLKK